MLTAASLLLAIVVPFTAAAIETETFGFEPWPATIAGEPRGRFDLRLPPGGETSEQARIYNKTDQPRTYRLYGADVFTDPQTGDLTTTAASADPTGLGSWIVLQEADRKIELGPREARVIDFAIERPAGATAGGLGALVAEELVPTEGGGSIDVRFRIALRIDATDDSQGEGMVVERLDLDVPLQFLPRTGTVTATLRNGDPDTLTTRIQLHVDQGGRRFVVLQEELTLRPGDSAEYEVAWQSVPALGGNATPGIELAWAAGNLRLDGGSEFVLPGWWAALLLLITAYLLVRYGRPRPVDEGHAR